MFDEMQTRAVSEDITHFFQNLAAEEQRKRYYEDEITIRRWFEVAIANRNADLVSQLVKFIHETPAPEGWTQLHETVYMRQKEDENGKIMKRHWGLTSYHYHCLLRVFTHQGDSTSIQQLTQIMQKRTLDERQKIAESKNSENDAVSDPQWRKRFLLTSTINANSIAWIMWINYMMGSLEGVLRAFSDSTVATESNPVSRETLMSPPDGQEDAWLNGPVELHCAPLSMLLYICCQYSSPMSGLTLDRGRIAESKLRAEHSIPSDAASYTNVPPELVVIIAAAKKLLHIPLTTSDFIHLLLAVLNNYRVFQRVQRNVLFNHRRSKELHSLPGQTSYNFLVENTQSVFSSATRLSEDDATGAAPHHVVPVVLRALRGAFVILDRDPSALGNVGFVQKRHATLNGWVRSVLDIVLDECSDPAAVFDALLAWSDVHGRPSFALNVSNFLYQRMQLPPEQPQAGEASPMASMRTRLLSGASSTIVPQFTSIAALADVIRHYPAARAAKEMTPKFVFFSSLCLRADVYKEDTRWYVRAQQMMFAASPQELITMLKEFVNTKYADDRKISFGVIREGLRCALDACVRFTPAGRTMDAHSAKDRFRWWVFNDARDISLTLYGSTQNTNEKVREIFSRGASPNPSKTEQSMHEEFARLANIDANCQRPASGTDSAPREAASWTGLPMNAVPDYFEDPEKSNPYPHICLGTLPLRSEDGQQDPFTEIFEIIQSCNPQQPNWYLNDKGTITRLLRCLLHRLEFRKAVDLMRSAIRVMGYGQKIDRDIQKFFREIGDPSGSIAFKLAAGIMDGEVTATKARHMTRSSQPT